MDRKRLQIEREISKILGAEIIKLEPLATVTKVKLSDKIGHANVFVGILGEESEKSFKKLCRNITFLRTILAKQLNKRYVPTLHFTLDSSIEHSQKMANILNKLKEDE